MANFPQHTVETASPEGVKALEQAKAGFGFVPNLIATMADAPAVANAYLQLHGAFASSSFTPAEQQVVTTAASFENGCTYCMAAESTVSKMIKVDDGVIDALRSGDTLPDARLNALATFTKAVVNERGFVSEAAIEEFLAAGFTRPQVLEVVLGVTKKTLSNYVNHIAETPLDAPFQPLAWTKPVPAGV